MKPSGSPIRRIAMRLLVDFARTGWRMPWMERRVGLLPIMPMQSETCETAATLRIYRGCALLRREPYVFALCGAPQPITMLLEASL